MVANDVARLVKKGMDVVIQSGAGEASGLADAEYEAKGASVATAPRARKIALRVIRFIDSSTSRDRQQ